MGGTAVPRVSWCVVHICSESSQICFVNFARYFNGTNVVYRSRRMIRSRAFFRVDGEQLAQELARFPSSRCEYHHAMLQYHMIAWVRVEPGELKDPKRSLEVARGRH